MKKFKFFIIMITLIVTNLLSFEELNRDNFMDKISKGKMIIDCYAPGCPPCTIVAKNLEDIKEYAQKQGIKIYKVNTREQREIAAALRIQVTPTLYYFKDGNAVGVTMGAAPVQRLKQDIERYLK